MYHNAPPLPVRTVMLNRATTIAGYASGVPNNELRLRFAQPQAFKNCEISLSKAFCFFSWFNITSELKNNQFTLTIPQFDSADPTARNSLDITLPDGIYEYADIAKAIVQALDVHGYYWISVDETSGGNPNTPGTILQKFYPVQLVLDTIQYKITVNCYSLSGDALPDPSEFGGSPWYWLPFYIANGGDVAAPTTPMKNLGYACLVIPNPPTTDSGVNGTNLLLSSFSRMTGIPPGTYPASNFTDDVGISSVSSIGTPQDTLDNVLVFNCNLANDTTASAYSRCIGQFIPVGSSGQQLEFQDQNPSWHPVSDGLYDNISIVVSNENLIPIKFQDPQFTAVVQIRIRS